MYVENKGKYNKKRKIQTSSNENVHKEQDDSSDYSDIESQCSFDKHLKFGKSYLPGHQCNYTLIHKDLKENKKMF